MRMQRDSYIITLKNDICLYSSFESNHRFNQIAAGRKAFKKLWDKTYVRIIFNIFLPIFMLALDFVVPMRYLFQMIKHKRMPIVGERYFIGHRRNLYAISKRAHINNDNDIWIRLLDDTYELPANLSKISILDLVTLNDFFKSWYQSIVLHVRTIFDVGYGLYFLSLKSFLWCLEDYGLRHLSENSTILFEDICDRNAILFDRLPVKGKIMVQHGTMHFGSLLKDNPYLSYKKDKGYYVWNSLYKSSPDIIYCYTKDDEWALLESIVKNKPKFIHIGYDFSTNLKPGKKSVLVVGNYYLFKEREEEIIKGLQGLDIIIYLKNHPSHSDAIYDELRNKYKFEFIRGQEVTYPSVDLLISYDSTLAFEYASIGTRVLYYGQFEEKDINKIVTDLLDI